MSSVPPLSVQVVPDRNWPDISAAFEDLTYEQSLTYGLAAARRIGAEATFVTLSEPGGNAVAAACLRVKRIPGLRRGIAWIAAGPLMLRRGRAAPDGDSIAAILDALRSHARNTGHVLRLRFPASTRLDTALLDSMAAREGFAVTDKSPRYRTVIADCGKDEAALMSALHGKWRNPLRNALKAGLELDCAPFAECRDRFDSLYREVRHLKGFNPDIPPEFYYALDGPDFDHEVLFARKDGSDIGAMTIGRAGQNGVYLFGATPETGRRLNAGHYLMWQAILRCRDLGLGALDLGGIDPVANPSVTRFKQRTGGTELSAAGPYEYRPPGAASLLIGVAETLHTHIRRLRS